MSQFTRRTIVQGGLAAAGSLAAPALVLGQARGKTLRVAGVGDVSSYDPVLTANYPTWMHAGMVYDMLFGVDSQQRAQPQMVSKYSLSSDKLAWTFELRDGLRFHDGTEVTTADVIPSINRWANGPSGGRALLDRLKDITAKDKKTFVIQLKEPFGLVPDLFARNCFIMRKKEAETDVKEKITTIVGSGPFKFNTAETRPGTQYVYDRNPDYVPRREAPSGMAGGKVVKLDRVILMNIADAQTGLAALQAGEIDYHRGPPADMLEQLSQDKNVRVRQIGLAGDIGYVRFNTLHPPFNNVKNRQAMLYIINQADHLKANFGNPRYYKQCAAIFGCGTALDNDANTGWLKAAPDYNKARQLLKEGGYDGSPVVILQGTDWTVSKNSAEVIAAEMRKAGMNVQMDAVDWAAIMTRRTVKAPPKEGGWSMFITTGQSPDPANFLTPFYSTGGDKAWWGWPSDAKHEELRNKFAQAETMEERKKLAREIQENWWNVVPMAQYGMWTLPEAMRANLTGVMDKQPYPWFRAWWNVDKT